VQQEEGRLLQVLLPHVRETGHGHAVDNAMVGGPAHAHYIRLDHLILVIETGHRLGPSHRTDGHLGRHNAGVRVSATNLKDLPHH